MIEILSLPRRHNTNMGKQIGKIPMKSGLPINSLPGWELIPLNSKLPMLKCPGNQVIFSKDKIGQSFKHFKQEFDPSGYDSIPEYNPLHDSNLKTFYANERNLKRLRENGEITQNNDVICNLKDFNEYRQQLHKSQLYYILQELNRLEAEQQDRMLIANAELITNRDHRNLSARQHSYSEILARKKKLDAQRDLRYKKLLERTEMKFQRIAGLKEMKKVLADHKKLLNNMRMEQHKEICLDIQRKQLISLKKLFQFKKERMQRNLRILKERKLQKAHDLQKRSWEKRLNERIANQKKMKTLLSDLAHRRQIFIEEHRKRYQEIWSKIQDDIHRRSIVIMQQRLIDQSIAEKKKKKRKKKKITTPELEPIDSVERELSLWANYQESFEKLLDSEVCEALNAALSMDADAKISFDSNDPIYKAATFINKHIIAKFDKDLSHDKILYKRVSDRIDKFFDEAKRFVTVRATQIIAAIRQSQRHPHMNICQRLGSNTSFSGIRRMNNLGKYVSFSRFSNTIGTSCYEIHPFADVRNTNDRTPTPAGSLASFMVESRDRLVNKTKISHLPRNEMVFIEHYITKFKRELIVGMGKRVFSAIRCHYENKILDVRKELVEMDRQFLINQVTKSILGYTTNSLNFTSSIKLCVSALASHIIWELQKQLIKPERDPRVITYPRQCCTCETTRMKLCLYCNIDQLPRCVTFYNSEQRLNHMNNINNNVFDPNEKEDVKKTRKILDCDELFRAMEDFGETECEEQERLELESNQNI